MNTATANTATQTNNLKHSILSHDEEGNPIYIKIRLNDECKNGHQDFAITCDIYEKGKPKTDRYYIMGGCCHEEIVKANPELKIFVDLHLCDYNGIPMHALSNMQYHLREGFNNTKKESPLFKEEYCNYYRITPTQFDTLSQAKSNIQFAVLLEKLGVLAQWKDQANKAIKLLENMAGKTFLVDSVKSQFEAPTPEEIKEEEDKVNSGYYTPEAEQKREEAKRDSILSKLADERDKEILKANTEYEVKKQVLIIGGEKALKNCIFYNHSNTLSFNWRGYDKISTELIDKIISLIQLPEGVTIENKNA